jgi:hypothetical protein
MESKEKKAMLYRFDPQIYPRRLWIQVGKEIPEGFSDVAEFGKSCDAQIDCCHDDVNNKGGVLLRFEDLEAMSLSTITHESVHAAIDILAYCDVRLDPNNQEPICYLAGWVTKCCEEVLKTEGGKHDDN